MNALLRSIKILNSIPNQRTPFGSTYEIIPELEKLKLAIARKEWSNLSSIQVDQDGTTLENYTVFQENTG